MDVTPFRCFFMWCSVVNAGVLLLAFAVCATSADRVYRMHARWFPMPRETWNAIMYGFVGAYKLLFLVFNLVPYVALVIVQNVC